VSQSSPVVLASSQLTRSGDTLTVELHERLDHPPAVLVVWPQKPQSPNPHLKRWQRWRARWCAAWRRRRRNSPRRSRTADKQSWLRLDAPALQVGGAFASPILRPCPPKIRPSAQHATAKPAQRPELQSLFNGQRLLSSL
jgi:hypothetical protein